MTDAELPQVEAEACAKCPHCGEQVVLRDASWRTHNVIAGAVQGEVICTRCAEPFEVEESLPA